MGPRWPQFDSRATGSWWDALPPTDAGGVTVPGSRFPLPGWPSQQTVEYLTKLIFLALILLALPYLIGSLLRHPDEVLSQRSEAILATGARGA